MDRIWLRAAQKLTFVDTTPYLIKLRCLEIEVALSDTDSKVKNLRTNSLKIAREQREAALFCLGMSKRLGCKVCFSAQEDQDYDFIARWVIDEVVHFAQVQLKELVPKHTNSVASIEDILKSLSKLSDSRGLTVAIHLNRECHFEPNLLKVPEIKVGSLWVFGSATPDQSRWNLWGNFIGNDLYGTQFSYPEG